MKNKRRSLVPAALLRKGNAGADASDQYLLDNSTITIEQALANLQTTLHGLTAE